MEGVMDKPFLRREAFMEVTGAKINQVVVMDWKFRASTTYIALCLPWKIFTYYYHTHIIALAMKN